MCRKIAEAVDNGSIELWGDGLQTRSFLYIDDCLDAVLTLTRSEFSGPYNIGSEEMISINDFAKKIARIANKNIDLVHIEGPTGVRGRCSDNRMILRDLKWAPKYDLNQGITWMYQWVKSQVDLQSN